MMAEIENRARSCEVCVSSIKKKESDVVSPCPKAKKLFERVHIDFFHFAGRTYLILIDSFSRWPEVREIRSTETQIVVQQLVSIFDLFGDPGTLVADNGPPFSGKGFRDFLAERDIEYLNSHPNPTGWRSILFGRPRISSRNP